MTDSKAEWIQVTALEDPATVILEAKTGAHFPPGLIPFLQLKEIGAEALPNSSFRLPTVNLTRFKDFFENIGRLLAAAEVKTKRVKYQPGSVTIHWYNEPEMTLLSALLFPEDTHAVEFERTFEEYYWDQTLGDREEELGSGPNSILLRYIELRDGAMNYGDAVKTSDPSWGPEDDYTRLLGSNRELLLVYDNRIIPVQFKCPVPFPVLYFSPLFYDSGVALDFTANPNFKVPELKMEYVAPGPGHIYEPGLKLIYPKQTMMIYFSFQYDTCLVPTEAEIRHHINRPELRDYILQPELGYRVRDFSGFLYTKIRAPDLGTKFYRLNPKPLEDTATDRLTRIRAGFFGLALGEALQVPLLGIRDLELKDVKIGTYGAATQASLVLARSLVARGQYDAKFVAQNYTDYGIPRGTGSSNQSLIRCFGLACLPKLPMREALEQDSNSGSPVALKIEEVYIDCLRMALGGVAADYAWNFTTSDSDPILQSIVDLVASCDESGVLYQKHEAKDPNWVGLSLHPSLWCLRSIGLEGSREWLTLMVRMTQHFPKSSPQSRGLAGLLAACFLGWATLIENEVLVEMIQGPILTGHRSQIPIHQLLDAENLSEALAALHQA